MLTKNDVQLKVNLNYFWDCKLEYENCYYKYSIETNTFLDGGNSFICLDIRIYDKGEYVKRRRSNFGYYRKSKIPYKHRDIVKNLVDIFEEEIILPTILSSNRLKYMDLFEYVKEKRC